MKNIYEVLRKKEADLEQVQHEIEALRTAERLLAENGDADAPNDAFRAPATANAGRWERALSKVAMNQFP